MWIILMLACCALGGIGSLAVNHAYKKWSRVPSVVPITGAEMASRMIQAAGAELIQINVVPGKLTDYFDPKGLTLNLSQEVANGTSIAAHAVACHEAGHYLQHVQGYAPIKLRSAMVPAVNISSTLCWILIAAGMFMGLFNLFWIAAICYGLSLLFSIVTLPVEFNASRRAVAFLGTSAAYAGAQAPVSAQEVKGSKSMLRSAALTYVMSTIASILNLLYILLLARR